MDDYLSILEDLKAYFTSPVRKTYWLYLLSSVLLALLFLWRFQPKQSLNLKIKKYFLNSNHWLGVSPMLDFFLVILNGFIRVILIVPFFMSAYELSFLVTKWLILQFDSPPSYTGSKWPVMLAYTCSLWLLGDFSRFFLHYLAHRIPFLWEYHKVHHSAEVLNPFTLFRQHPLEMFLFHLRGSLVFGLVTGFFYYRFSGALALYEILGINAGRFIFLFLGANLRHSHIPLRYGKFFEHIFISPLQHQIHHSINKEDHHKNMGSHLAIWDWMFGTLKISDSNKREFIFGIPEQGYNHHNFWQSFWEPIKRSFKISK